MQRPGMQGAGRGGEMRADPAGRGRSRLPAGAADQRRRAALPGRCRGGAVPHRRPGRAAEIADELSRANGERRATEREVDGAAEAARRDAARAAARGAGAGRRRRGLAPGRDRDRRLAPGRAPPPAGDRDLARRRGRRPRVGPQHPRLRPARRARGLRRAPGLLRRPPRRRRAGAAGREPGRLPRGLRRPRRRGARPRGADPDRADRRDGRRRRPRPRPRRGARPAGPVRDGQPRRAPARPLGPGPRRAADGGGGQARALQPPQRRAPGARASPSAARSSGVGDEDTVDAAVRLEVNHWNGAVEPRVVLARSTRTRAPRRAADERRPRSGGRAGGTASRPSCAADAGGRRGRRPSAEPRRGCGPCARSRVRRRRSLAELASSGEPVLALVADLPRRAPLARDRRDASPSTPSSSATPSWPPASSTSSSSTRRPSAHLAALAAAPAARAAATCTRPGASASARFAIAALEDAARPAPELSPASTATCARRRPRAARGGAARRAARVRRRTHARPRPRRAASAVLAELGLVRGSARSWRTASSGSYPQRRPIWSARRPIRAYSARYQEGLRYLEGLKQS